MSKPKSVLGTGAKGDLEHPELNEVEFSPRKAAAAAKRAESGEEGDDD